MLGSEIIEYSNIFIRLWTRLALDLCFYNLNTILTVILGTMYCLKRQIYMFNDNNVDDFMLMMMIMMMMILMVLMMLVLMMFMLMIYMLRAVLDLRQLSGPRKNIHSVAMKTMRRGKQ